MRLDSGDMIKQSRSPACTERSQPLSSCWEKKRMLSNMFPSPRKLRLVGEEDKQTLSLQDKVVNTKCGHGKVSFLGSSLVKKPPANAGAGGSIPGSGRSPGEGNGNPLQNFCFRNPTDRGAWQATVHGVAESQTRPSEHMERSFLLGERGRLSQEVKGLSR